jgi:hypothetical protein
MDIKFNHDGYTYFTNRIVAFRHHGVLDEYKHLGDNDGASREMIHLFDDPANRYDYRLAEIQPNAASIAGKDRFLFGYMKQLVKASYVRMVWKIMGKNTWFYTSSHSRLYPVLVHANSDWEAIIMPIRYDLDDLK